jgi:hypothetical protein
MLHAAPARQSALALPVRAVQAGGFYFSIVFAAGFALGAVRQTLIAPRIGPVWAVLCELPLMLAISWIVAGWTVRRFDLANRMSAAAAGAIAFALLMLAEFGMWAIARGLSIRDQLAAMVSIPGVFGLIAQLAFAVMPMFALRRTPPVSAHRGPD